MQGRCMGTIRQVKTECSYFLQAHFRSIIAVPYCRLGRGMLPVSKSSVKRSRGHIGRERRASHVSQSGWVLVAIPHSVIVFGDPFLGGFQFTSYYHSSMVKKPHPRINHQHSVFVCRLDYQIISR